jgi:hypothetical protein
MEHKNKIIASAICNYECKHKEWCNGRCNVTIELEPYIDRLVATAKRELMQRIDKIIEEPPCYDPSTCILDDPETELMGENCPCAYIKMPALKKEMGKQKDER